MWYDSYMKDELIDIVNEKDEVVGTSLKHDAHAQGKRLRISHVFIFNSKGELALQLRSTTVSFKPGHWVTTGSGHIGAGETYLDAGIRELREEAGIDVPLTFEGTEFYKADNGAEEFLGIMRGTYDGNFICDADDVAEIRWCLMEEVQRMVTRGEPFHPEFLFLLRKRFGIS